MPDAERLEGGQTRTEQAGVAAAQMAVVASSEALPSIAEATPAEIEDMVRQLDRLSADAVTCLENATRASEQAGVTADAIEGPDGHLLAAMLERQQVLLMALERQLARGGTSALTPQRWQTIVATLEQRNRHCRRLLVSHVEALEARLAGAQRQQEQSRSYRTHEAFAAPGHM